MTSVNDMPADIVDAARVLNMKLHNATELGQRTQWIAEALFAASQRDQWQDIATAPKDGTKFLAFEIGEHFNCWWHDNGYGEQYWMDEADTEPNPTHWMPLPEAPK